MDDFAPHWFIQNFSAPEYFLPKLRDEGEVGVPTKGWPTAFVDTRDIADTAATVPRGRAYRQILHSTGPIAHTWHEAIQAIVKAAGHEMWYVDVDIEEHLSGPAYSGLPNQAMEHHRAVHEFMCSKNSSDISGAIETILSPPSRALHQYNRESVHLRRRETTRSKFPMRPSDR